MGTISRLNKQLGIGIIHITHIMTEVVRADRVVVMERGRVAMEGSPKEVFSNVDLLHRLDLDIPPVTQLARRAAALGVDVDPHCLEVDRLVREVISLYGSDKALW